MSLVSEFICNKDSDCGIPIYILYFNDILKINNELDEFTANKLNIDNNNYKKIIENNFILDSGEDILNFNCADDIVIILDDFLYYN